MPNHDPIQPRSVFEEVGVELKQAHSDNEAGCKKTDGQKCSDAEMFAEELPNRVATYVPTQIDPVPAIVPTLFLNMVGQSET